MGRGLSRPPYPLPALTPRPPRGGVLPQYAEETAQMREEVRELRTTARVFQATRCSMCSSPLELPVVHFLCMHSVHIRCLGENEQECPVCAPKVSGPCSCPRGGSRRGCDGSAPAALCPDMRLTAPLA